MTVETRYRIISLGRDFPGKITDFAEARNSFLRNLPDGEWILFLDDDAEASQMLLDHLKKFQPPSNARYYSIRVLNLVNGRYSPLINPFFWRVLVSNKARYFGKIHERIRGEPTGIIDYPIIHNKIRPAQNPDPFWNRNLSPVAWNFWLAGKKLKDILVHGHHDPRVW